MNSSSETTDWEPTAKLRWNGDVLEQLYQGFYWYMHITEPHAVPFARGIPIKALTQSTEWRVVPQKEVE